jgi:hypothetical protein
MHKRLSQSGVLESKLAKILLMSVKKSESLSESNKVSEFGYQTNFNFKGEQPNPLAQTPNNFTTLIHNFI